MTTRRQLLTLLAGTLGSTGLPDALAAAGDFPLRPIRLVVPFAPGGVVDIMARSVAPKMAESLGQPVVVDNKPGGGSTIGADQVAKAPPDGHTVLLGTISSQTTMPHLSPTVPYDSLAAFAPVGFLGFNGSWLVVPQSLPAQSFGEFVQHARRQAGKLSCGTPGIGSSAHLTAELLKQRLGLAFTHVPYKGSAPALQDLLGGHVDFMFDNVASSMAHVRAGRLRALAVTSRERLKLAPDVPTIAESGVPGFDVVGWAALFVPTRTPAEAVAKLNRALNGALAQPDVAATLLAAGIETRPGTAADLDQYVRGEFEKWGKVIRTADIKSE